VSDGDSTIPSGLVTFLFSDVVGSTRIWAANPDAMTASLKTHDQVFESTVSAFGGHIFSKAGDSLAIAFSRASTAVQCAEMILEKLAACDWGETPPLLVRMGMHLGEAEERDNNYFGPTVNLAARVMSVANGGQCIVTDAVRDAAAVVVHDVGTHTLRDIDGAVHLSQLGDQEFSPIGQPAGAQVSLPFPRTSLVGREAAIEEVRRILRDNRFVTLTGVGGCGKTRLAIEIAHRESSSHPEGTWFVDLSTIADESAVPGAVAASLGLSVAVAATAEDQILGFLSEREALLVVDNCEHVIDAAAGFIDAILERTPRVRVLATSRESLEVEGEFTWKVPSLALDEGAPALQLFFERAGAAGARLVQDGPTSAAVAEIVDRLDGIPLAIELAAARTRSLGLTELATRLDDRFRLLSGASRRSRQRQATLEAAVQWSYDLLTDGERAMLETLSVFQGGFAVGDAAAVADKSLNEAEHIVDGLVAKSLVDIRRDAAGELRHRLLETIRLFALERLVADGFAAEVRDAHLRHFSDDPAFATLETWSTRSNVERVGREFENLRAAIAWALDTERPELAVRLAAIASDAAPPRGEVQWMLDTLRTPAQLEPTDVVHVHTMLGWNLAVQGDLVAAGKVLDIAIRTAEEHHSDYVVVALAGESVRAFWLGEFDEQQRFVETAQAVAESRCGPMCQAFALLFTANYFNLIMRYEEVVTLLDPTIAHVAEFGYFHVLEAMRAWALLQLGRTDDAIRAVATFSPIPSGSQWATMNLLVDHVVRGHRDGPDEAARSLARLSGELVPRVPQAASDILVGFAYLHRLRGEEERMREILTAIGPVAGMWLYNTLIAEANGVGADGCREFLKQYYEEHPVAERFLLAAVEAPRLLAEELEGWS
jgi:predicted ATPase/class 3 adenylate cyclase